jgi:hypothetical protein
MTDTLGVQPTYEQLRDSVENNEARAAWMDHDRRLSALTETYRTLKDDARYTEEHKANQMWEAYEKESEHIQAAGERARVLLEKEAQGHEMMSVPRPKGERLTNLTAEKLIAAQNEAGRILRKVERMKDSPIRGINHARTLKDEYQRGIEVGGVEGVAICKGTLMAADELGIAPEEFLNDLRTPEQLAELDKAQRCQMMAFFIGKHIPEPPLRRPGGSTPSGAGGKLFIPQKHPVQTKRAPSWK